MTRSTLIARELNTRADLISFQGAECARLFAGGLTPAPNPQLLYATRKHRSSDHPAVRCKVVKFRPPDGTEQQLQGQHSDKQ